MTPSGREKSGDWKSESQKHHRAACDDPVEVFQGRAEVRLAALWLEIEHLADDPQDVAPPFARRQEELHLVREEQQPDLVAVADGAEGQQAGHFRGEFALGLRDAAERAGGADIDEQQHGQLAFLGEVLDVQVARARGDVAVDEADLVAGVVGTHVLEVHPAPLEHGMVLPGEGAVHQPPGAQFQPTDFFEDGGGVGHVRKWAIATTG